VKSQPRIAASEDRFLGRGSLPSRVSKTFPSPAGKVRPVEVLRQLDLPIHRRRISRPGGSVGLRQKSPLLRILAAIGNPQQRRGAGGDRAVRGLRPPSGTWRWCPEATPLSPPQRGPAIIASGCGAAVPQPAATAPGQPASPQPALPRGLRFPRPGRRPSAGGSPRWPNNSGSHPARSTAEGALRRVRSNGWRWVGPIARPAPVFSDG